MKKRLISLLLCGIFVFGITGCDKDKVNTIDNFEDEVTGIKVVTKEYMEEGTKLSVKKDSKNYLDIDERINKYVAYDISLIKDDNELNNDRLNNTSLEAEVSIKIPSDFNKDNLVVYYILGGKIEETFNVTIEDIYAKFKTTHFSTYMLAELKDVDETNEQENEEVNESEESIDQVTTSQIEDTSINTEVPEKTCTPKKFANKYTYVYDTKYACDHDGEDAYYYLYDNNIIENLMFNKCEEIVDDCGDTYWGLYFTIWTGPGNDDYQDIHY